MATVMTSKAPVTANKMKKPSLPAVQTGNNNSRQSAPSSSPSSSVKRLPGQTTPQSATHPTFAAANLSATTNGNARPNRRLQRLITRTGTSESVSLDKKAAAKKFAAPYVSKEAHILKKYKGRPPSLIVHLHPTHFRFDQQDGSFSYQSEMRMFIEHLQKKTIPHDMLEEFRRSDVQFYDGWLIVRVVDHKSIATDTTNSAGQGDDSKPFSIHNHNSFITPSPYAPFSARESRSEASPAVKKERQGSIGKENVNSDLPSDDTIDVLPKNHKPQPKVYHIALRPTQLSMHIDVALDAMTPDPKTLNRKQSSQPSARTPAAGQPPTPIGAVPPTPTTERPPPLKKQKLKIDPKDLLEYESRIVNATAPPLYLDLTQNLDEVQQILNMLKDAWHDQAPPSPKSRKRTVAELAADDALAKEQERFMLIMDERGIGNNNLANAAGVDGQSGAASFQPRFERFNALDQIKREIEEKKQREKDRQLQEDEARRGQQQQQEEERRRNLQMQAQLDRKRIQQAQAQQAQQAQAQAQQQAQAQAQVQAQSQAQAQAQIQQQQQAQAQNQVQNPNGVLNAAAAVAAQRQQQQQQAQARMQQNRVPPQMQNQMAATQASSPVIRQGTPQAASSPIVAAGSHPMVGSGSQQGQAGSPARPGSALQHAHPGVAMARGPSAQGPSRNGTPQLPQDTPSMRTATTPVMRQGTPSQMNHGSPAVSMPAPTPQMTNAGMVGPSPQMNSGMGRAQLTPQQAQEMRRQQIVAQQQMMNGNMNGSTLSAAQHSQIAHARAQQQVREHNMAIQQQQQQAKQQQAMQHGTPQPHHMSPNPSQNSYKAQMTETMKNQMASVQQGQGQGQGSPALNQMTPQMQQHFQARVLQQQQQQQQQAQQLQQLQAQQQQQQQAGQMGQQMVQQRPGMSAPVQQQLQQWTSKLWHNAMAQAAQKYGGNTSMVPLPEQHALQQQAQQRARQLMQQRQQQTMQSMQQQRAMMQQQQQAMNSMQNTGMGQMNPMAAQIHQRQQAQQMQELHMRQAQNMMAQQQAAQGTTPQQQYQMQMQQMQQAQQMQQGMMNGQDMMNGQR